ncbi:MAG: hypothetical protein IKZ50_05745 [Bacteroidales bacterium]|nr:hypothetical protein [Bacteroidales bacterium]
MKKILLFAAAVLALAACSKESPVKEEGIIDASKIVFKIDVRNANDTKGVKTAWEDGDVVYAFFEDNTTQYVKMTYNGTSWAYTDKDGGTTFSGLTLSASGKKVSAIYFPGFVCSTAPNFDTDCWKFGSSVDGYYQYTNGVDYTVTSTSDVTTLNATLSLTAHNFAQIFIPDSEAPAPASGNEYVLTATHIIKTGFSYIYPGGDAVYGNESIGFPLKGYHGTLGGETGYYFWGMPEYSTTHTYDFTFQLVERNIANGYAISSKSKTVNATVGASFAAKLTGLTDNGKFVSLGYDGGPLWATGNLDKTNNTIVDPLAAGEYFMYGYTTPYNSSNPKYTGMENPLSTDHDAAYQANNAWRIPTKAQFEALISSTNKSWKTGWTTLGSPNGGYLITSKSNGISLFLAAAGYWNGTLKEVGTDGYCWSSTPYEYPECAYSLDYGDWSGGYFETFFTARETGLSIRPVKN